MEKYGLKNTLGFKKVTNAKQLLLCINQVKEFSHSWPSCYCMCCTCVLGKEARLKSIDHHVPVLEDCPSSWKGGGLHSATVPKCPLSPCALQKSGVDLRYFNCVCISVMFSWGSLTRCYRWVWLLEFRGDHRGLFPSVPSCEVSDCKHGVRWSLLLAPPASFLILPYSFVESLCHPHDNASLNCKCSRKDPITSCPSTIRLRNHFMK